jgi:hypothetical protein
MVLTGSKAPAEPPITMMSRCGNRCLLSFELRGNRKLYGWFEETAVGRRLRFPGQE